MVKFINNNQKNYSTFDVLFMVGLFYAILPRIIYRLLALFCATHNEWAAMAYISLREEIMFTWNSHFDKSFLKN